MLAALHVETFDFVTHDLGVMVAYAFTAQFPQRVGRWVAMEAPLPGIGPWEHICAMPAMWQFGFGGPDMERLVAGRERIYLDRFWNEFSRHPERWDEAKREHYASLYAQPGAMHAGFSQFNAFVQDAQDNQALLKKGKLKIPVLAIGGDSASGKSVAMILRFAADDVTEAVVPDCGHWLMEEQSAATTKLITGFLNK